jgi:hypothetical protein
LTGAFHATVKCLTSTVKIDCSVLPLSSVAEQVTVVSPIGNVEPDAGRQLTGIVPS